MLARAPAFVLRLSLHRRIAVFVSGILLAVFLAFWYVGWDSLNQSKAQGLEERQATAQVAARHLDELVAHAHAHMVVLARDIAADSTEELDGELVKHLLGDSLHQQEFWFSYMLVFDPQRQLVASVPQAPTVTPDLEARAVLDQALRSGQPAISNLLRLPVEGSSGVLFVAPIVRGDRVLGVIAAEMTVPHPAVSNIAAPLRLGRTGHVEVLDGRGRVLASTYPQDILGETEHPDFYLPLLASRASAVGPALHYARQAHQTSSDWHIMAFVPLANAPWGVGLGQDEEETFATNRELRDRAIVMSVVALLVALGLAWMGTQSVVHPIRELTQAGERMATGDLSEPIRVEQPDEVGRLAQVLEVTRQRLGQSLAEIRAWNHELERRVSERTRDLETSNRYLHTLMAVATAASGGMDRQGVLSKALRELADTLGTQSAWAFLWDEKEQQLRLVSDYGLPEPMRSGEAVVTCAEARCVAALRGSAIQSYPIRECPALPDGMASSGNDVCWCAPIRVGGEPLGVLCLSVPGDRILAGDEVALMQGIAQQVAVAFENARLIEERTRLEAARGLELLRAEFLASVSHELRTPLGFIKGYATTLLRNDVAWDRDQQREFLEIIDEECDRLTTLVESLLDAARAQAGRLHLHTQPVPLEQMLRRSIDRMAGSLGRHHVDLQLEASPTVVADESRLEQVVVNLLQNAVKYSPDGGPIEIHLGVREEEVRISVLDQGLGMPSTETAKIFEPFYRIANGPAGVGGAGLGLTICRAIVEAHGGRIWAEPRPDGRYVEISVMSGRIANRSSLAIDEKQAAELANSEPASTEEQALRLQIDCEGSLPDCYPHLRRLISKCLPGWRHRRALHAAVAGERERRAGR